MSAITGAIGGALALLLLDAAVAGKGSSELGGASKILQGAARVLIDPTVPLIPDRRSKAPKEDNPAPAPKKKVPQPHVQTAPVPHSVPSSQSLPLIP
jgi:hypothetical protein